MHLASSYRDRVAFANPSFHMNGLRGLGDDQTDLQMPGTAPDATTVGYDASGNAISLTPVQQAIMNAPSLVSAPGMQPIIGANSLTPVQQAIMNAPAISPTAPSPGWFGQALTAVAGQAGAIAQALNPRPIIPTMINPATLNPATNLPYGVTPYGTGTYPMTTIGYQNPALYNPATGMPYGVSTSYAGGNATYAIPGATAPTSNIIPFLLVGAGALLLFAMMGKG
jgi:hypothetical protein